MSQLDGRIALITGGTSGIGLATAQRFIDEGARVIVTGRNPERVAAAQEQLGERALAVQSDAADLDALDALVATVKARFDRLDVLFLNAGVFHTAPAAEEKPESFDRLFAINVKGPYFAVQRFLPLMSAGGSVLFNTSVVNVKGMPGASVYGATKAALRSITRTLAAELAPQGIRVNAVSPGPIATPILDRSGLQPAQVEGFKAQLPTMVPLGRFGRADELAAAAVFLASDQGSFVTGAELAVDGGFAQV